MGETSLVAYETRGKYGHSMIGPAKRHCLSPPSRSMRFLSTHFRNEHWYHSPARRAPHRRNRPAGLPACWTARAGGQTLRHLSLTAVLAPQGEHFPVKLKFTAAG